MLIVTIAAILVASIRLNFADTGAMARAPSPKRRALNVTLGKGAEMGWFEHGSTIICFVPSGVVLAPGLCEDESIRAGQRMTQLTS
ncbi:phosphatidylserine decarboxylase [Sphingomonas aerophila]|uniref:Phosphatidylserine decarboxylase n=1 Tax=Sphingomonas aerophila TaxID=1344948 RepID=A0A7W9BG32_9SPHN|nr:phosphatidylserine decarboxylase [Sphingomonas aerophila]MBB5716523.1 phosphatidylserine decarboxylase [Sphingomonas aerophila]